MFRLLSEDRLGIKIQVQTDGCRTLISMQFEGLQANGRWVGYQGDTQRSDHPDHHFLFISKASQNPVIQ